MSEESTLKYTHTQPPTPWKETHDLSYYDEHPDYQEEFDNSFWPTDGFIDDLRSHTLGYETTNLFSFWTAVSAISAVVQRDAFLRFGDGLYPNFFTVLVAPPAIAHKSTAMNRFEKIEQEAYRRIPNKLVKEMKKSHVIRGKASAEQLFASMANKDVTIEGDEEVHKSNANLIMRVSELGTFLSKAQYNTGLIDKLTDFYDCKDYDSDSTISRGHAELENIFATMFACTTPDALANSIPQEAFGGGFMSRCIIAEVKPHHCKRIIPVPFYPTNAPDRTEMADRLIWIMNNKKGEYALTESAFDYYTSWYREEILDLRAKAARGEVDHRDNRKTLHVLKLALVFALQRYSTDRWVTEVDLDYAIKVLEYTNNSSSQMVEDISIDGQTDGRMHKFLRLVRLAGEKGIPRVDLSRNHNFKKGEIDKFLEELESREMVVQDMVRVKIKGKIRNQRRIYYKGEPEEKDQEEVDGS